jgi:hypothetical protein
MTWSEVHRYYAALRRAESDLDRTDGELIWRAEYRDVFASPEQLLLALRSYWITMVRAQVEWDSAGNWRRMTTEHRLAAEHPGLVRALARHGAAGRRRTDSELVGAA